MLAIFKNKKLKGIWHKTEGDQTWLERTCRAISLQPSEVEVFECPPLRSDANYSFEFNESGVDLVMYRSETTGEGEDKKTTVVEDSRTPLEKYKA